MTDIVCEVDPKTYLNRSTQKELWDTERTRLLRADYGSQEQVAASGKGTIESFLRSIRQILCDIFTWLRSKREMLFDFCLQSCALLHNAATLSCKRAKAGLAALKMWLINVRLLPDILSHTDMMKVFRRCFNLYAFEFGQEYWVSKQNMPPS